MVSIITPVWNKSSLTHQFIFQNWNLYRSVPDVELIIIDNGSTDNTPALLNQWLGRWDNLRVITNADNRGFGPANNQGANVANGDAFIFLSNDVGCNGDYVTPILAALKSDPAALVAPNRLDYDTGWNKFGDQIIPYLAGWCVALTRATFGALGGWDERYIPSDYEDVDLSYTATQQGRDLVQIPLPLFHVSGVTATQLPDRMAMTIRHRRLFAEKWGLKEPTSEVTAPTAKARGLLPD